jgi:hypothetical protein
MTIEKEVEPSDTSIKSDKRALAKKEWHRPGLQKLPIKATSVTYHSSGNDGNVAKKGAAGYVS